MVIRLDGSKYQKVLNFEYKNLARSFEKYKNSFYFGIGCDLNNVNKFCGDILRVNINQ